MSEMVLQAPDTVILGNKQYDKTGTCGDLPVYCETHDWNRFCKSFSDKGGYVYLDGKMVPLEEHKATPAKPEE